METRRRTMPTDVGQLLLDARLRAGLRLREAARVVGISHSHLFRLEACLRVPSRTVAILLADALALTDPERARLLEVAVTDAGRDWPGRKNRPGAAASVSGCGAQRPARARPVPPSAPPP